LAVVIAAAALLLVVARERAVYREQRRALLRAGEPPLRVADALAGDGMYKRGVEIEAPDALRSVGLAAELHAPYLPRPSVDGPLREQLEHAAAAFGATLVVLSGPSKAGKSRTLAEALAATLPQAFLIEPADAAALVALANAGPPREVGPEPVVVWLDDLEPYVGYGGDGLNTRTLRLFECWQRPVLVVAAYGGKGRSLVDLAQVEGEAGNLLHDTEPFELVPWMTERERKALKEHPQYASTAERIADAGIAEFMIVGRRLRDLLTVDRSCPEGVAVAQAAIDWLRGGILRPVPLDALEELFGAYVAGPSTAERFHRGLEWATRPVYSNVALLQRDGEGYSPYGFAVRVERERNRPMPDATRQALVERYARAEDLRRVGMAMELEDDEARAEMAWRRAADNGDTFSASRLGLLLQWRGDMVGAEAAWRRLDDLGGSMGAVGVGMVREALGDNDGAEVAYRSAYNRDGTSVALARLGVLMHARGDLTGAEAAWREAADHGSTLSALRLGKLLRARGDLDGAEAAFIRANPARKPEAAEALRTLRTDRETKG
jgi:hypothetical protein